MLQLLRHDAKEIAEFYGFVTVADMMDLSSCHSAWGDYDTFGWTKQALARAVIEHTTSSDSYRICMPEYDWGNYPGKSSMSGEDGRPKTVEPINITISSGELDTRRHDIEDVLHLLFENADKIKDRPVFISLM